MTGDFPRGTADQISKMLLASRIRWRQFKANAPVRSAGLTARGQSIRQSTYFPSRLLPDTTCGSLKTKLIPHGTLLAAAIVTTLISGCAIADFTTYSGQQQNWPTQPGSFVATQYAIPAYIHSYPDRPYNVIGYLDATTAPIRRRGCDWLRSQKSKRARG
jgi:hypothetical protein